jgi:hypothetical protein
MATLTHRIHRHPRPPKANLKQLPLSETEMVEYGIQSGRNLIQFMQLIKQLFLISAKIAKNQSVPKYFE